MRYANIRTLDVSNGEGIGVSLFVQGCHFHCHNCFNPETWDFSGGKEWNKETQDRFLELANRDYIKRISILGGEPLNNENVATVVSLLEAIREKFGDQKKVWLYTGYLFGNIVNNSNPDRFESMRIKAVTLSDIVVDGQYIDNLKDYKLKWRGSSNQRVIDVKKSVSSSTYVLYCE